MNRMFQAVSLSGCLLACGLPRTCSAQVTISGGTRVVIFDTATQQYITQDDSIPPPLTNPTSITGSSSSSLTKPEGTNKADLTLNASLGQLRGDIEATKDFYGAAVAGGTADFTDTITVSSDTLTAGTMVQIRLQSQLSGTAVRDNNDSRSGSVAYANGYVKLGTVTGTLSLNDQQTNDALTFDLLADVQVGQTYKIEGNLLVREATQDRFGRVHVSEDYRLTPNSGGFQIVSGSGHSYAATPAPGSLLTALLGIVPGVLLKRRSGKQNKN